MPIYCCDTCNNIFNTKKEFNIHVKTHKNLQITDHRCIHCKKYFSTRYNLQIHTDRCKESVIYKQTQHQLDETTKLQNKLKRDMLIKELKEINNGTSATYTFQQMINIYGNVNIINNTTNNTTNNTIINNTTNNLNVNDIIGKHLNKFGTEIAIEQMLSIKQREHIVQQGGNAVTKLTHYKHFNTKLPENHNMYLDQKKHNHAMIFDGEKFIEIPFEDIINYIILKSRSDICSILTDPNIKLDSNQKRNINNLIKKISENNSDTKAMIEEDLRAIMYDNRELVIKTFKTIIKELKRNKQIVTLSNEVLNNAAENAIEL
jgi:hypothetical protein